MSIISAAGEVQFKHTPVDSHKDVQFDKARFFKLKIEKCMSTSAAAKQLGIHVRTAQRWVKQYEECPDSIFERGKKKGRGRILTEEG
ncbi:hypothetical protein VTP01DRAFT_5576, partial [Rhizomucor pusillus]|uniref:uncharacterized protein n=1 Tax=Rhizomucor pusillus TaxID=4840 RepID=UPI0037431624